MPLQRLMSKRYIQNGGQEFWGGDTELLFGITAPFAVIKRPVRVLMRPARAIENI